MLSVRHGARAVEFYKAAFGAVEVYRVEAPDGAVVSRLAVDGAEFWVADESPQHHNFSPESLGGGSVRMILTVPDPDAMFAKALAAGAREVSAVQELPYGWRLGRVVDPFGHHWEIGRPTTRAALFKGRVSSRVILRGEDALPRLCQGSDRNMSGSGLSAVQGRKRLPKRRESGAPQREPTNPQPGAGNQRVRHVEIA